MSAELIYAAKWARRTLKVTRKFQGQIYPLERGVSEVSGIESERWLGQLYLVLHHLMSGYHFSGPRYKEVERFLRTGSKEGLLSTQGFVRQRLDHLESLPTPQAVFPREHPHIRVCIERAIFEALGKALELLGHPLVTPKQLEPLFRRLLRGVVMGFATDYRYDRVGPKTIRFLRFLKKVFG